MGKRHNGTFDTYDMEYHRCFSCSAYGWWISQMSSEVKRLNILLNMTRESYIKREDHQSEMSRVVDHLVRLEGKIDKLAEKV